MFEALLRCTDHPMQSWWLLMSWCQIGASPVTVCIHHKDEESSNNRSNSQIALCTCPICHIHYSEQKCANFYSEWWIVEYVTQVHCGICEIDLLWNKVHTLDISRAQSCMRYLAKYIHFNSYWKLCFTHSLFHFLLWGFQLEPAIKPNSCIFVYISFS